LAIQATIGWVSGQAMGPVEIEPEMRRNSIINIDEGQLCLKLIIELALVAL